MNAGFLPVNDLGFAMAIQAHNLAPHEQEMLNPRCDAAIETFGMPLPWPPNLQLDIHNRKEKKDHLPFMRGAVKCQLHVGDSCQRGHIIAKPSSSEEPWALRRKQGASGQLSAAECHHSTALLQMSGSRREPPPSPLIRVRIIGLWQLPQECWRLVGGGGLVWSI